MCFLTVFLVGCGALDVDLPPEDKDGLAEFVDNGGDPDNIEPDPAPVVEPEDPAPDTPMDSIDLEGADTLEHVAWDAILAHFVDEGRVDYAALNASPESMELLDRYLVLLASVDPAALASPEERLAFWLNAYNALVLRRAAVLVAAKADFSPQDDDFVFFKQAIHTVGGAVYSLDQIEHGVIRGDRAHASVQDLDDAAWAPYAERHAAIFGDSPVDPRIHVGLNCAAVSCPFLPSEAFLGATVQDQLDARSALFVADPARGAGPQGVSSLFTWFAPDFDGSSFGSARGFVEAFRDDVDGIDFDTYLAYDWTLNRVGP